jgi:hypothetical protein
MDSSELIETYLESSDVTSRFCALNSHDKLVVIELGLAMFDHAKQHSSKSESDEWRAQIARLKGKHVEDMTALQNRLDLSDQQYETFAREAQKKAKYAITAAEESAGLRYAAEVEKLRANLTTLEEKYNALFDKYEQQGRQLIAEHNEKTAVLERRHSEEIASLRSDMIVSRRDYEEKLLSIALRGENSTVKGQDGENYMLCQLTMMFPSWEIEDAHSEAGRGDFILRNNGFSIMIENKNYSKNVQKSEVDKFYRDVDNKSNSDIDCALMVSMNTGICCKGDFQFEMRNGKPIMFLHRVKDNARSVALAIRFLQLVLSQSETLNLKDEEVIAGYKNLASSIKRNFTKQKNRLDKFYAEQLDYLSQLEESVGQLYGIVSLKY